MELIDILAIIVFVILLAASIYMLYNFYVCDRQQCKIFKQTDDKNYPSGRDNKEYVLDVLNELYSDGIWPLPYIGASILTPLSLWFIGIPITVKNFAIMFVVSFIVIYFLFSFFGHHYIRFVTNYVSHYIQTYCPSNSVESENINKSSKITENLIDPVVSSNNEFNKEIICNQTLQLNDIETENKTETNIKFKPYMEGFNVTFSNPINVI